MKIINCQQGDPTWMYERCGRLTASRMGDVMARLKNGKPATARHNYMMEKLTEVLTGQCAEHFVTDAMQWGIEHESVARSVYEINNGVEVELVGMVIHPRIDRGAASPDGLCGDAGIVEFKCPTTATHLEYLLDGVMPDRYVHQCQWQLACTERDYCDFVSFDPRLPSEYGLFIVRLERDANVIAAMEAEVIQFIGELNQMAEKLQKCKREVEPAGPGPERAVIPVW